MTTLRLILVIVTFCTLVDEGWSQEFFPFEPADEELVYEDIMIDEMPVFGRQDTPPPAPVPDVIIEPDDPPHPFPPDWPDVDPSEAPVVPDEPFGPAGDFSDAQNNPDEDLPAPGENIIGNRNDNTSSQTSATIYILIIMTLLVLLVLLLVWFCCCQKKEKSYSNFDYRTETGEYSRDSPVVDANDMPSIIIPQYQTHATRGSAEMVVPRYQREYRRGYHP